MDSFLKEVKTTKKVQNNIDRFESLAIRKDESLNRSGTSLEPRKPIIEIDTESEAVPFLTAVTSKPVNSAEKTSDGRSPSATPDTSTIQHRQKTSAIFINKDYLNVHTSPSLVDDAREILKSKPGIEDIEAVLDYLHCGIQEQHEFNIKLVSPMSSMLVRVLVTITLPDVWPNLSIAQTEESFIRIKRLLTDVLFSITGLEAILEQIRTLTRPFTTASAEVLKVFLDFLDSLLGSSDTVARLLRDMKTLYEKDIQRRLFWQGVVSLLGGSKILSTTASVPNAVVESVGTLTAPEWLVQGQDYSKWLARNIVKAAIETGPQELQTWSNLGQLFRRGLSLGYKDSFVSKTYTSLLLGKTALWSPLHHIVKSLSSHDQKTVFDCILNDLARSFLTHSQLSSVNAQDKDTTQAIAGAAGLIQGLISHNDFLTECAIAWVSTVHGNQVRSIGTRRALIAVLAQSEANIQRVLERSLSSFSDKVLIQNMATAQQEHLAQTILLAIGYLFRLFPAFLKQDAIPSLTMNAVSNRLASSVPRTRLLGMILGVAMSQCVDEPERVMDFQVEEMETTEVEELLALTRVQDRIGSVDELKSLVLSHGKRKGNSQKHEVTPAEVLKTRQPELTAKVMTIEEVATSSDDEDDLVPYRKPLADPEDSDEDPTLINREKPRAPIYIADLIKQLQSTSDKLDIIAMALKTAPTLIRRKSTFGTELSDNIHSLASTLINLQDGMSKPEHQQERLDALIACFVAQPEKMSKYLTNTYFNGDYSISQRSTLLIAIGLSARELAGFSDSQSRQAVTEGIDMFPSQRLPSHLQPEPLSASISNSDQKGLIGVSNPVSLLTNMATQDTIRPMALAAADAQTGAEVLKVNRTSSHLSMKKEKLISQKQKKAMTSRIFDIIVKNVYLPLASPLVALVSYASASSGNNISTLLLHPSILTLHLQTLTLLLHTLGPAGLSPSSTFSSVTHETVALLTALQHNTRLSFDGIVLPATLGLFLALIDITTEIGVTAQERLLSDPFGTAVSELVRWVGGLEENGRAPPPTKNEDGRGGEGVAWTILAAGIQVRWWEMGRRFQGRMLGLNLDE